MNRIFANLTPDELLFFIFSRMKREAQQDFDKVDMCLKTYSNLETLVMDVATMKVSRKKPVVVCLIGLPQEGKTTFADALASAAPFFRVNSNIIRNWLVDVGSDYSYVNTIALSMMIDQLKKRQNVIMDSDHMLPAKRAMVEAVAKMHGAEVRYVHISSDRTMWLQRLINPLTMVHRMYADGVKRSNKIYHNSNWTGIPLNLVLECVNEEWLRQREGHIAYARSLEKIKLFFVPNSVTKRELEIRASQIARLVLVI